MSLCNLGLLSEAKRMQVARPRVQIASLSVEAVMPFPNAISFDKKMQCDKLQLVVIENFGLAAIRDLDQEEMLQMSVFASQFLNIHFSSPHS